MIKRLAVAISLTLAVVLPTASTADAGGYWRGYALYGTESIHAYSYNTPTYGHYHVFWGVCRGVRIVADYGNYVLIEKLGFYGC